MIKTTIISVSLILGILGLISFVANPFPRIVYIDMGKVYDKFNLSKELNDNLKKTVDMRKQILDSLFRNLRQQDEIIYNQKTKSPEDIRYLKGLEQEYLHKQEAFENENRNAAEACNEKIWKQINQYTERYGKEMGYDYVLGANGQGNIMYGKDKSNVTDDLIEYLNAHYDDKVK